MHPQKTTDTRVKKSRRRGRGRWAKEKDERRTGSSTKKRARKRERTAGNQARERGAWSPRSTEVLSLSLFARDSPALLPNKKEKNPEERSYVQKKTAGYDWMAFFLCSPSAFLSVGQLGSFLRAAREKKKHASTRSQTLGLIHRRTPDSLFFFFSGFPLPLQGLSSSVVFPPSSVSPSARHPPRVCLF